MKTAFLASLLWALPTQAAPIVNSFSCSGKDTSAQDWRVDGAREASGNVYKITFSRLLNGHVVQSLQRRQSGALADEFWITFSDPRDPQEFTGMIEIKGTTSFPQRKDFAGAFWLAESVNVTVDTADCQMQ